MAIQAPHEHALVAEVAIGTPPQRLKCLLDSHTAELWLPVAQCADCGGGQRFHPDRSRSFVPVMAMLPGHEPFPVPIIDAKGRRVGFAAQDTVQLGPRLLRNQSIMIVDVGGLPRHASWDCVCGLGWARATSAGQPMYKNMQASGDHAIFALVPFLAGQTYLVIGEIPVAEAAAHTLAWVDAEAAWLRRPLPSWVVKGAFGTRTSKPTIAHFILDTEADFLLAPNQLYKHFVRSIFSGSGFDRLCGADASLGNLIVCDCSVGHQHYVLVEHFRIYLGGRAFVFEVRDLLKEVASSSAGSLCLLQIQPGGIDLANPFRDLPKFLSSGPATHQVSLHNGNMLRSPPPARSGKADAGAGGEPWVLGGVFLERLLVVLDFERRRVGFAEPLAGGGGGSAPSQDAPRDVQTRSPVSRPLGAWAWLGCACLVCGGFILLHRQLPRRRYARTPSLAEAEDAEGLKSGAFGSVPVE